MKALFTCPIDAFFAGSLVISTEGSRMSHGESPRVCRRPSFLRGYGHGVMSCLIILKFCLTNIPTSPTKCQFPVWTTIGSPLFRRIAPFELLMRQLLCSTRHILNVTL